MWISLSYLIEFVISIRSLTDSYRNLGVSNRSTAYSSRVATPDIQRVAQYLLHKQKQTGPAEQPPLSILIFQHGLDFPAFEAIQDYFFEFSRTHEFGTFSTQTQLFLKVSKTRIRLIFLKSPTGACQIPLKSILAAPPWKISIRDDSGVKFWLTLYLTNRYHTKKTRENCHFKKVDFFSSLYSILYSILLKKLAHGRLN